MMKRFALALVALAAVSLPARAAGVPIGFNLNFGISAYVSVSPIGCNSCYGGGYGGGGAPLGPWYSYWPMEAHFQTPAPTGYPFWPSPMASSLGAPPVVQPVGYNFAPPSYWYGR
jgi:hypothetical protein